MQCESNVINETRIVVVGFGNSGKHIVDNMLQTANRGIEHITVNTESDYKGMRRTIENANMVFVAGGLGKTAGHNYAPAIARIAKEAGALTIGVVSIPFLFEGRKRRGEAEKSLISLKKECDSVVIIPNDVLLSLSVIDPKAKINEAFRTIDHLFARVISAIVAVVISSNENDISLDLDDLKTIMNCWGTSLVGIGEHCGKDAAYNAIMDAMNFATADGESIQNASGVLVHFTMHPEFYFMQLSEAMDIIHNSVDQTANVIFGTTTDENLPIDYIKITLIVTGIEKTSRKAANNLYYIKHQEGFEAEAKFHEALGYLYQLYYGFQSKYLKDVLRILYPDFLNGLFEQRECIRKLRYIGESNERFTNGRVYQSKTFNGATYEVVNDNGNTDMCGSVYFEWVDREENKQ